MKEITLKDKNKELNSAITNMENLLNNMSKKLKKKSLIIEHGAEYQYEQDIKIKELQKQRREQIRENQKAYQMVASYRAYENEYPYKKLDELIDKLEEEIFELEQKIEKDNIYYSKQLKEQQTTIDKLEKNQKHVFEYKTDINALNKGNTLINNKK